MRLTRSAVIAVLLVGLAVARAVSAQSVLAAPADLIRVNDSLAITVAGQPTLTGIYRVSADGTVAVPLAGVVPAANLTTTGLMELLARRLDAFVLRPDVRVSLVRQSRVFVLGEVRAPGPFPLTRGLTIVEALTQAGYTASGEVLLIRTPGAIGPVLPDNAEPSNVVRVNLHELERRVEAGDLSGNVSLKPNDTVFVPKLDPTVVYVVGQVRKPGAYSIPDGTTVLQAVTLAGGPTDRGAINSTRVSRWTESARDHHARLSDEVHPGDSIDVPEAFEIPSVISIPSTDPNAPRRKPFRILLGPNVAVMPSFSVSRLGADTSVFAGGQQLAAVPVAAFGPALDLEVKAGRLSLTFTGRLGISTFPTRPQENSLNPGYGVAPSVSVAPWLTLRAQWDVDFSRERWNTEVDLLARRRAEIQSAGFTLRPFRRLELYADASDSQVKFDPNQILYGVDIQQTLTEHVRNVKGDAKFELTPQSNLIVSASKSTHRFPLLPVRDANGSELAVGVTFKASAFVTGQARVGWLQYIPLDRTVDPFDGPSARFALSHIFGSRTTVGGLAEQTVGTSFAPQFPFAVVDRAGGWVQQMISRRFDVVGEVFNERFRYREFARVAPTIPVVWSDADTRRYSAQFGVRVGAARIAANGSVVTRRHPATFESLLFWVDMTIGVFDVRNR